MTTLTREDVGRLRELREVYACMATSHEGEPEGERFAAIVKAADLHIDLAERYLGAAEGEVVGQMAHDYVSPATGVIVATRNAAAVKGKTVRLVPAEGK